MPPRPARPSCTSMCAIRKAPSRAWTPRIIARLSSGSGAAALTCSSISRRGRARVLPMTSAIRLNRVPKAPEERVRHVVELKPDICSLDMGSLNMGDRVFINAPKHLQAMAVAIKDAGVMPELEVFETGHLLLAKRFIENGYVKPPGMFQICLGFFWGQPATTEAMTYMRNLLPPDAPWFAFGISLHQFPMVAQTVLLGGHPRVGLEDNIYLEKGKLAPSNAALVEKAANIIQTLGDQVATPAEARQILGLAARNV